MFAEMLSAVPTPSGAPVPTSSVEPFWQRFLTSAGFGGVMALGAAAIAARIAAVQLRHTKSQQRHDRWWDTLTWVYDRAVVEKDKRTALPHHVTFAMLSQLAERAQMPPEDVLQQGAIKSILSIFEVTDDVRQKPSPSAAGDRDDERPIPQRDGSSPPSVIQVSDPAAAGLLDELRNRLSSEEELRDRWGQLRYLNNVKMAVGREAAALGADVTIVSDPTRRANVAVAWEGREVLIWIRYAEGLIPSVAVLQAMERLHTEVAASYTAIGGLIVFNVPLSRTAVDAFMAAKDGPGVEVVTWAEQSDDALIRRALERLRPSDDARIGGE